MNLILSHNSIRLSLCYPLPSPLSTQSKVIATNAYLQWVSKQVAVQFAHCFFIKWEQTFLAVSYITSSHCLSWYFQLRIFILRIFCLLFITYFLYSVLCFTSLTGFCYFNILCIFMIFGQMIVLKFM